MFVVLVVSSEAVTIAMPRRSDLSHFTDGKEPMHTKHLGEEDRFLQEMKEYSQIHRSAAEAAAFAALLLRMEPS